MLHRDTELRQRWGGRACAVIGDSSKYLRDVVRDLLANPQIRIVVFDGAACGRDAYDAFWRASDDPGWRIEPEHISLVRRFVDLYDDDFKISGPMQPFWPARIMYNDDKEKRCD